MMHASRGRWRAFAAVAARRRSPASRARLVVVERCWPNSRYREMVAQGPFFSRECELLCRASVARAVVPAERSL